MAPSEPTEEAFLRGQQHVLAQTATGTPLPEVLDGIVRLIEAQSAGMLCSILLVDRERQVLRHGAAPSLPAAFCEAIDGEAIGPAVGSCGTAAYLGETVIVEDIATHPYWRNYKALALPLGLHACWSSPIQSSTRAVLGTFAMYYREPRAPSAEERHWVAIATHLAGVAIVADQSRASEAALLQSEAELRAVFDHAAIGIALMTREGRVVRVNRALCHMLGYTEGELLALPPGRSTHPEDSARDFSLAQELLAGTRDRYQIEKRYVRKDSGIIWTRFTVSNVPGASTYRLVAMVEDITAQRELEQKAKSSEHLDGLAQMAGVLAHDFNNVLTAIQGSTHLALEELAGHPTRALITDIEVATARAIMLVQRLLTFSPNAELRRASVRLDELLQRSAQVITGQLPERVTLHVDAGLPQWVHGDAAQLQQVVVSLATNGIQAMPHGGELWLRLEGEGNRVRLTVSDTGVGIVPGDVDRVFEPFFTTRAAGQGAGLGLAIARAIVRGHDGTIGLRTTLDGGTTFEVSLPTTSAPATLAKAPGNEHVLFVDDESVICRLAKRELERAGFRVSTFDDPELALAAFKGAPAGFDAIVTDASMPKLSGFDVAREVRVDRPNVPIVVISGGLWNRELYDPLTIGEFLLKPQALRELGPTLRRLLDA